MNLLFSPAFFASLGSDGDRRLFKWAWTACQKKYPPYSRQKQAASAMRAAVQAGHSKFIIQAHKSGVIKVSDPLSQLGLWTARLIKSIIKHLGEDPVRPFLLTLTLVTRLSSSFRLTFTRPSRSSHPPKSTDAFHPSPLWNDPFHFHPH